MKHIYHYIILACLSCSYMSNKNLFSGQKAIINVPIVDLVGQPITTIFSDEHPESAYNALTFCSAQTNSLSCPRLHQLLYNDTVNVIKTTENEALVSIMHSYYLTPSSSLPQTNYWLLKKKITLYDKLILHNIPTSHIPDPIDFSDKDGNVFTHTNIITLTKPHYDPNLKLTFSVGTRFTRALSTATEKRTTTIDAFAIDYTGMKEVLIKIPSNKCKIINTTQSIQDRIADYVNLLRQWTTIKDGCIPYTWGGTSFAHTTRKTFKEIIKKTNNGDIISYAYENDISSPKSGFDCSGVIIRATQICGIPYFCKNTTTIPKCLTLLDANQSLSEGDLILIRGHVMVVSDIAKNLLIEARSYAHGYGKLHEIAINKVFEGIETYTDLINAYHNKTVIKRKDKQGKIRDTFSNLQLFSMSSVWNKKES
ncbi:MAG TPA: hypothetical protein VLB80_00665 [Candidatus Babeliales bacterium]|nr:hypothetical protein [Candidatus Babeliales bacterium]